MSSPFDSAHTQRVISAVLAKVPSSELRFNAAGEPQFTRLGFRLFCEALEEASAAHPELSGLITDMKKEFEAQADGAEGRN